MTSCFSRFLLFENFSFAVYRVFPPNTVSFAVFVVFDTLIAGQLGAIELTKRSYVRRYPLADFKKYNPDSSETKIRIFRSVSL